jgi:hypothetical protein
LSSSFHLQIIGRLWPLRCKAWDKETCFTLLLEKIGTNRRLLDRKITLDFKKPFDLIPYYKRSYDKKVLVENNLKNPSSFPKNSPSQVWSQLLNAARTYFETIAAKI